MGCILHIPRHLLFVPARVNNFLLSGRFHVGAAKGMCEVCRTKRFKLTNRKMLCLIKVSYGAMAEMEITKGQLPFSNIAMPNFKGFFLGDFIKERMRFSTTLGSSS
jgi:hypothetical protein